MQKRLIIIGIAAVTITTSGYVSAQNTAEPAQRQSLLSRLRDRSANQQVQAPQTEVAQTRGYRPGVTIPQQQQQQTPAPARPIYPQQAQYPAYPPQQAAPGAVQQGQPQRPQQTQVPYNMQQQQARQTPVAGAQQQPQQPQAQQRSASSNNDESDNNQSRSSSSSSRSNNDSASNNRSSSGSSSNSRSSDDSNSKSSSKKSSSSSKSSSSKSDNDDSDSKKSSTKSESSSALKKIADKVDSDNDSDSDSKKDSKKAEKKEEPKKSDEEIAREKAHAAFLKAADEATTVVATFLKQANDGYYSKASDSLSPAIKKYFDSEISAVSGTEKTVLDELTANGTITMVTYVNTTVRGEGAVVEAELGYADGRTARRSFDLIKIDDDWKIVLPVTGIMANGGSGTQNNAATVPANSAPNSAERAAAANVAAHAAAVPPTAEQAAAQANPPLVLAPDASTSAPK